MVILCKEKFRAGNIVEALPSKHKALSSNPITIKNKKESKYTLIYVFCVYN
jgi:hypothetical protein